MPFILALVLLVGFGLKLSSMIAEKIAGKNAKK